MTQALHTAIESVNALSLEEKHQLWLILDEAIAQAEEQDWLEDDETAEEIQQVREEYRQGEYITFHQYLAQK
ncbi:MAG: hypothetical protein ACK54E_11495 [Pseudanabaena sp.]|jgi:hypothetical protein|nr:hypothetical protein [Pseudanabaena sp. M172S2SP2A07QC]MCA6518290.1 hypothetical protein [Pseudanabaena sp. M110S1SP2A07QC]MCA6523023.1 hypothetical protein [Pseudanabaena sp. M051S1SP2A07QC]MCA6525907.1 hypothetical protein [Pseudanabaena sp. M179S2SP2A07QC]MCA6531426.1 hypothetical protein [Pseudanabaena sp. M125S2SP2A07QC]MCA6534167.1 hypothetical protein [Pseudanabaena sp. M176S2SP2A07QC]MCA6540827.1 hypothetical protein [Pseudanabaena sp. M037S2SP2A07QC]MCA6543158.1 hypothetical prot